MTWVDGSWDSAAVGASAERSRPVEAGDIEVFASMSVRDPAIDTA